MATVKSKADLTRKILKDSLKRAKGDPAKLDRQKILTKLQAGKDTNMTPGQASTYYHKYLKELIDEAA